jgi:hypothetical protein
LLGGNEGVGTILIEVEKHPADERNVGAVKLAPRASNADSLMLHGLMPPAWR